MSREYPCVYHKNGLCEKDPEPGYINYCVFGPCHDETPSNGDRIRAMSDEELAQLIYNADGLGWCSDRPECAELLEMPGGIPEEKCLGCLMAWLRQPAEVSDHA